MNPQDFESLQGPEKSIINSEQAKLHAVSFLQEIFTEPNQVFIADPDVFFYKKEYKDRDKVEVGVFSVGINLEIDGSDNEIVHLIEKTTNPEIANYLNNKIIIARRLRDIFNRKGIELEDETITIQELRNICGSEIPVRMLMYLFDTTARGEVKKETIDSLLNGEITAKIELAYKRIHNAKRAIANEIENYEIFYHKGFNTFCALKTIARDQAEESANDNAYFIFTLNERNLIVLEEEGNFFSEENGVFELLLKELSRMYLSELTHGDLHFRNVGYLREKIKNIMLFDLVRSTSDGVNHPTRIQNDLILFRNTVIVMLRNSFDIDKNYVKSLIDQFLEEIKPIFENNQSNYDSILDSFISIYEEIDSK
ncbi:MAG: hypothetical protein ABI721_01850 [Candidatus Dojkabacteria bacterium]